jgi:hypothetical protein
MKSPAESEPGRFIPAAPTNAKQPAAGVEPETEEGPERLRHLVVVLVASLYRPTLRALAYAAPLACYLRALHQQRSELTLTVVREIIVKHRRHQLLHTHQRRHSALGMLTPIEYERQHTTAQTVA